MEKQQELSRLVHEHPKEPTRLHESRMMLTVLCSVGRWRHLKVPRGPPEAMTMTGFVVLVAGLTIPNTRYFLTV